MHCKAGLGRTGLLLCSYMMKHYGFTAHEAIGYIRICRPGSVIGCQQQWLEDHEAAMHAAGRLMRKQLSHQVRPCPVSLPPGICRLSGRLDGPSRSTCHAMLTMQVLRRWPAGLTVPCVLWLLSCL